MKLIYGMFKVVQVGDEFAVTDNKKVYRKDRVFSTRLEAKYEAAKMNVAYFHQKSEDAWDEAARLAKKMGLEVDESGLEITEVEEGEEGGWKNTFNRGDLIC